MRGRRLALAACGGLMMIAAAAVGAQASEATIRGHDEEPGGGGP